MDYMKLILKTSTKRLFDFARYKIAALITYLPYTRRLSSIVDRLIQEKN